MADEDYIKKFESLQQYIPFLENMIVQLKDPNKKNREQQLSKMESLLSMITDRKKKLKLETLSKCEDVIIKLYEKVNHKPSPAVRNIRDSPMAESGTFSTPTSPSPPRDFGCIRPVVIPTEKIGLPSNRLGMPSFKREYSSKIDVYSSAAESLTKKTSDSQHPMVNRLGGKFPDMSKPPISLDDLKTLEDDVQDKIKEARYQKASVDELSDVRTRILQQLRECNSPLINLANTITDLSQINTTVRNNSKVLSKKVLSPEKAKLKDQNSTETKTDDSKSKVIQPSPVVSVVAKKELFKSETKPNSDSLNSEAEKPVKDNTPAKDSTTTTATSTTITAITNKLSKDTPQPVKQSPKPVTVNIKGKSPKVLKEPASIFGSLLSSIDDQILCKDKKEERRTSISKDEKKGERRLSTSKEEKSKKEDSRSSVDKDKKDKRSSSINRDDKKITDKKENSSKDENKEHKKDPSEKKKDSEHHKKKEEKDSSKKRESKEETDKKKEKKDSDSSAKLKDQDKNKDKSKDEKKGPSSDKKSSEPEKSQKPLETKIKLHEDKSVIKTAATTSKETTEKRPDAISEVASDRNSNIHQFKRLADKYNPKPKKPTIETTDVDKEVKDSIEQSMKISPVKIPPLLGEKVPELPKILAPLKDKIPEPVPPPPVSLLSISLPPDFPPQNRAQLPSPLSSLVNPSTTALINNVVNHLRNVQGLQTPNPPLQPPTPEINFPNNFQQNRAFSQTPINNRPGLLPTPNPNIVPTQFNRNTQGVQRSYTPHPLQSQEQFGLFPGQNNMHLEHDNRFYGSQHQQFDQDYFPELQDSYFTANGHHEPNIQPYDRFNDYGMQEEIYQRQHGYNHNQFDIQPLDYYPPNAPQHSNTYNNQVGPPLLSPQGEFAQQFHMDQKPHDLGHFTPRNHDPLFGNQDRDMRMNNWPNENRPWQREGPRDPRLNRDPRSYREYREMMQQQQGRDQREQSRDPREQSRDPREQPRDPRDMSRDPRELSRDPREQLRDPRELSRDPREARDPRLNDPRSARDYRENDRDWNSRDRDYRDSRDRPPRDSRYDRDADSRGRSRYRDFRTETRDGRQSRYDSRFDKTFSRLQETHERSRSRSKSPSRSGTSETFTSPLDSLYASGDYHKTGKGYGVQTFRIPKVKKEKETEGQQPKGKENLTGESDDEANDDVAVIENEEDVIEIEPDELQAPEPPKITKDNAQEDAAPVLSNQIESDIITITDDKTDAEDEEETVPEKEEEIVQQKVAEKQTEKSKEVETKKGGEPEKKALDTDVMAQFFSLLMGGKKDQKGILLSLINTFSDGLSETQLKRIKQIMNTEDEESSDEEEAAPKKADKKKQPKESMEREETIDTEVKAAASTNNLESPEVKAKAPTKKKPTRSQAASAAKKIEPEPTLEVDSNCEDESEMPVIVTVGERIKNRRRSAAAKAKPRHRSELDMLHEDIKDMFIRDGVLTATGKRMCRMLKDDPEALDPSLVNQSTPPVQEESKRLRRKPGPKPKKVLSSPEVKAMSNVRVLLSKMPDPLGSPSGGRVLRSLSKRNSYVEENSGDESSSRLEDAIIEEPTLEDESDKEDLKDISDVPASSTPDLKSRPLKRKRNKAWASGIITKKKKGQKKLPPSEDSQDIEEKPTIVESIGEIRKDSLDKTNSFIEPDKHYYLDETTVKSMKCKLCDFTGRFLSGHYKSDHPESEVLCSRLSPATAAAAIKDSEENLEAYEKESAPMASKKLKYSCRICEYTTFAPPPIFYDHVTTHTAEFRHVCATCGFAASNGKRLLNHFNSTHDGVKNIFRQTFGNSFIFGYLCGDCNFVQINRKSVEDHVNIYHLSDNCKIYKINMSTVRPIEPMSQLPSDISIAETVPPSPNVSFTLEVTDEGESPNKKRKLEPGKKSKAKPASRKKKKKVLPPIPTSPAPSETSSTPVTPASITPTAPTSDYPEKLILTLPIPPKTKSKPCPKSRKKLPETPPVLDFSDVASPFEVTSKKRAAKEKAAAKLKEQSLLEALEKQKQINVKRKEIEEKEVEEMEEVIEPIDTSEIELNGNAEESPKEPEVRAAQVQSEEIKKEVELNVFTCETDIQEENEKIERERMQKMEELNKTICKRSSNLNFLEKLRSRIVAEETVKVKEEPSEKPEESPVTPQKSPSPVMPVLERNLPTPTVMHSKITLTEIDPITSSAEVRVSQKNSNLFTGMIQKLKGVVNTTGNDSGNNLPLVTESPVAQKNNDGITGMIQKLKGVLNTPSDDSNGSLVYDDYGDDEGPPPLTHVNEIIVKPSDQSTTILNSSFVKIIKNSDSLTYSCLVPPCAFSTEDQNTFLVHCREGHRWIGYSRSITNCETCGMKIIPSMGDNPSLEDLFHHITTEHGDFLKAAPKRVLRMRRLSGDKLSVKVEGELKEQTQEGNVPDDVLPKIQCVESLAVQETAVPSPSETEDNSSAVAQDSSVVPLDNSSNSGGFTAAELVVEENLDKQDDNPFPFKIADVVSLADSEQPPPLRLITQKPQQNQHIFVKEAKLSPLEIGNPRKTAQAMAKFLKCVSELYKCPIYNCSFSTNFRDFYERHLAAHKMDSRMMVACVYCDLKTPVEHSPMHIDIRHAQSRFACNYCMYRGALKEYVMIHQDLHHPRKDYSVLALPKPKTAKKYCINESKKDLTMVCDPYICIVPGCDLKFLYHNEFRDHMVKHASLSTVPCGSPLCKTKCPPLLIINHWQIEHKICMYQCAYCRCSADDLSKMYEHTAVFHQNSLPDILVRQSTVLASDSSSTVLDSNKYFLSKFPQSDIDPTLPLPPHELGYSPEAFKQMPHIESIPKSYLNSSRKPLEPKEHVIPFVLKKEKVKSLPPSPQKSVLKKPPNSPVNAFRIFSPPAKSSTPSSISYIQPLIFQTAVSTTGGPALIPIITSKTTVASITKSPVKIVPATSSTETPQNFPTLGVLTPISTSDNGGTVSVSEQGLPTLAVITDTNSLMCPVTPQSKVANSIVTSTPASNTSASSNKTMEFPMEHINVNDEPLISLTPKVGNSDVDIVDPLSIDDSADADLSKTLMVTSSEDETEERAPPSKIIKSGLVGYQLYRCGGGCDSSFSNLQMFKKHVVLSVRCKGADPTKPYQCVHCGRFLKTPHKLAEHIQYHGSLRFSCSLCDSKFATLFQVRGHMRNRHSVPNIFSTPLNPDLPDPDLGEFIVRPKLAVPQETPPPSVEVPPATPTQITYLPDQIDDIPIRSIFSSFLRCGLCSYLTKVRTNMVRHLKAHSEEKNVPDSAPVNPVPCLDKNEKMFDKMTNLANSSFASRMGAAPKGQEVKVDKEDAEKIPEFVPSHCRFVCCADGCNYLCPEESNLRHHLEALHDGESSFVCAHCKRDLSPTDVDGLIKHFKLHGLSLFKCQYCSYVHNLQHKVTRHLAEDHADLPSKVVTIRSLEAEPKDQERVPVTPTEPPPPAAQNKSSRPWRCCMCKYRCSTVEEIEAHALNKHEIDSQYKCTLCTYKSKDDTTFESHFQENHPGMVKDIIHVYRKEEEQAKAAEGDQQFDTTPLWQRDKPRVRHIRGILFEETAPGKSPKKPVKASPGPASASNSLNLDLSIEAVATGTSFLDETSTAPDDVFESINRQIKESEEDIAKAKDELTKQNVIVIDDDDEDETVEVVEPVPTPVLKVPEPMVKAEVMRDEVDDNQEDEFECKTLKKEFGGLGQPFNKQFQCPKCENFKTKRVMDFIYHIYKDMKCNRFKCKICELGSVTEEFMKKHIANEHPSGNTVTDIVPLRANRKLEEWIQYVLRCQSKIILKNNAAQDPATNADATPAATATENLDCPFCDKKFGNISLLRDHQLTHWSVKPFECKLCKYKAPTEFSAKKHHKLTHSGEAVSYQTVAPLVTDVIKKPKIQHKKPKAKRSCPTVSNEDNSKKPKLDKINEAGSSKTTETVAVEKKNGTTDKSSSDTIKYFACEICLEVAKSYKEIEKHIKTKHENSAIRYKKIHHSLNPKSEDLVGCNYCSFTGTEVDLRLHHQDKHTEDIKFKPYKFTCFECSEKLSATNGIKLHYKKHPGKACKYLTLTNQILEIPMQTMTYKCPMCDYSTTSTTTANISLHLKKHFRSYQCGNCKAAFSTRSECSNHLVNEHSDPNIPVAENDGKGPEFQNLMKEIIRTAKLVKPGEISPDKRKTARKSTASYLRMEEFSYYGVKPEPEDLKKITTTVELDSVDVTMTVEQLTKIYNIFPDVSVEDCGFSLNQAVTNS